MHFPILFDFAYSEYDNWALRNRTKISMFSVPILIIVDLVTYFENTF